jgi:hypothetical protein
MAKFNYNISLGTVPDMIHIGSQDMDTKIAFAYLMDTYDDKDITWAGVGRFVKETGTDITNYITLGGGGAVSQVAKIPAKEALKKTIMSQITKHLAKPIVQSVPVGAGYAGGFNVAQQKVKKEAGLQKGISGKEAAVSAAVGAVVAPVAVKGVEAVGKGIKKAGQLAGKGIDYINREGEEAMAQVAAGGTPPTRIDNLNKWHSESHPLTKNEDGTPTTFYHGTTQNFDTFDNTKSFDGWHFFTENPEFADYYASKPKKTGSIMPVYINSKNVFSPYDEKNIQEYSKYLKNIEKWDDSKINQHIYDIQDDVMGWREMESTHFKNFIDNSKHDSFLIRENGVYNIAVKNRNQIKSIHNRGTFDESNSNILYGAGAGGVGIMSEESKDKKLKKDAK